MRLKHVGIVIALIVCGTAQGSWGQGSYKQPSKEIMDVLNAPAIPATSISPIGDKIALFAPLRYPPISERAEPMLRLAGLRINPKISGPHGAGYFTKLTFKNVADGQETLVDFPVGAKIKSPSWSPDGKHIAVGNITASGVELWIVDVAIGKANKVNGVLLNETLGGFSWVNSKEVLAFLVSGARGVAPPYQNLVPTEPNIQETSGKRGAVQTFQDLLKSPNDEKLFEYYCTSQIAVIGLTGKVRTIGAPAIYDNADISPDGKHILVSKIERPFSYLFPYYRFPTKEEVWSIDGKFERVVANVPLQDSLPVQGVTTSPRSFGWIPTEAATLMWVEALDGGDPRNKITPRDKLMTLMAPFTEGASELLKVENRYQGRQFGEKNGLMFYYDYDRDTQHRRIFMTDYRAKGEGNMIFDLNNNDRYNDMGQMVTKMLPDGQRVVRQYNDGVFLTGDGASPTGDRPFFRFFDLKTQEIDDIWRSSGDEYESFAGMLGDDGERFFTRKESISEPPNLFLRQICPQTKECLAETIRAVTDFKDPTPQLRGITKELVKYKRADGVELSFTLYLPPGYKKGTKLPTLVWAYPLEFTDASTAGQVSGSTNRFTQISGISHLFMLLQGYAVLDNATMPVIGDPETVNDTFIKQIVDSAQAAIDKGVEIGVVDRDRVAVGGHSYGAFMTANLLAHSDMFRAGIARSGAYNRTLTPFGFQSERRTFWEAPELYAKVSPFFVADKINEPILLIHGEADNNQGTFPIQSERMFAAISGTGGKARLVMLPLEAHGYSAKESVEHTLYEMTEWLDKYVKTPKSAEAPKK